MSASSKGCVYCGGALTLVRPGKYQCDNCTVCTKCGYVACVCPKVVVCAPDQLNNHQEDYAPAAWEEYTFQELGMWVHLYAERATHRTNEEKRQKDLYDATSYAEMLVAKLKALKERYAK
jgi:hypothetical protein